MKRKLLLAALLVVGALGFKANAQWTDYTSAITNPSFETGDAIENLTSCGWATDRAAGWTIAPSSPSNAQIGIANSSSTVQGINSHSASAGDKYLYIRYNWNANAEFSVAQTTTASLPAGMYCLSVKIANFASQSSTWTLSVQEGNETAVITSITGTGAADSPWNTMTVFVNKASAETALTIKASMKFTGSDAGSRHFCMLLDDFQLKKADNPAALTDGEKYYLRNVATGKYWGAGNGWGTQASLVDNPEYVTLHKLPNGAYTLESQVSNGGTAYYFNGDYMDNGSPLSLFIGEIATSGEYWIGNGTTFFGYDGSTTVLGKGLTDSASDNCKWEIIDEAGMLTETTNATVDAPVNATWLILDQGFGRNNRNSGSWTHTNDGGDFQLSNGDNTNNNMQQWNGTFNLSQDIKGVPNGAYKLTVQGFYRNGSNADAAAAYNAGTETIRSFLFANDETVPVMSVMADAQGSSTGGFATSTAAGYVPNSQSNASACFTAGYYNNTIWVAVTDGNLTVGAKCEENISNAWTVLDNFVLTYYGDVTIAEARLATFVTDYNAAMTEARAFTEESMFAAAWDDLQDAISNNTLDLNDPALTEDDLTTATANLVAANTAATAAVAAKTTYDTATTAIGEGTSEVDLTSLIGNPSFESTAAYALVGDGWINEGVGVQGQTNNGFDGYRVGNVFAERWVASGSIGAFKTYQNIAALPAGLYRVSAVATFNGNGASLFANDATATITDATTTYSVLVQTSDKGSIELGVQAVNPTGTWFKADNFTLTYMPDFPAYTLAEGKMGTDKSAAQTAAETTFNNNKTVENYNALLAAIADAEASVANYAALKAAIDKAEDVKEANNFVTADATTALESEITTATAAWTDVTYTDAQATAEIAVLGSAVSGWHAIAIEGKAGAFMASAWGKTSENWWDAPYINTWSVEGDNDGTGFSVPFFEYYTDNNQNLGANTFTATLTGMDNGYYEVELWARVQRRSDADFNGDNSMITMSVNGGDAVSIMSNTSNNVGSGTSVMRLGRYTAVGEVTDGTLTLSIDVKLGANVHWLSWRDVKYTYLGDAAANLAVKAEKYGTFVAPFDVEIPEGIVAYAVQSVTDKDVKLVEINNSPLAAQTPVILKNTTDAQVTETFYGTSLTDADTEDSDYLVGVYKADVAIPEGSYVLQTDPDTNEQAFYVVGSGFTSYANRCYLTSTVTGGANVRSISFAGEATGIEAIGVLTSGNYDAIYTAGGAKVNSLQKGLNIVVKDGKSYKIFVK